MKKLIMQKKNNSLIPVYSKDIEIMAKIKDNDMVSVEIRKARNPRQHALFFALLSCVLDNSENFKSMDEVLIFAKYKLGLIDMHTIDGKVIITPKSIAFENMDNIEFTEVLIKALDIFAEYFQWDKNQLRNNYQNYL